MNFLTHESLLEKAFEIPALAFPNVVVAGLRDSVTACTIAVMLVIASVMMSYTHDRKKALSYACAFIATLGVVYFLIGVTATKEIEALVVSSQFILIHDIFTLALVALLFLFGVMNVQDYFFGKKLWLDVSARHESLFRQWYRNNATLFGALKGIVATPLLLVCTLPSYTHAAITLQDMLPTLPFVAYIGLYVFMTLIPLLLMLVAMISVASHMERHDVHSGNHAFLKIVKGIFQICAALALLYIEL